MADGFGGGGSVRRLGQALLSAGRGLAAVTDGLSGKVHGLIPSGWSGNSAEAFSSDWNARAQQAAQLAAVCMHVGQVLTGLAEQLDAANRQAAQAQRMTGGPESRFALPSTEQKSQQLLSQASGSAQQARAAARAKLAGIAVPKIGPPLTARQVTAWAERLAPPPKPSQPWYDSLWHGAEFAGDGLLGTAKGLGDLVGMGPLYGDPSFAQTWNGMGHLVEPWNWSAFSQSWEGLGKGLLAWNEWKSDPARASGQVVFNAATLGLAGLLKLGDAGELAADAGKTADAAGDLSRLTDAERVQNILNPGGDPIGVPGNRPVTRLLGNQQEVKDVWAHIKAQLGRPPDRVINTPNGPIDRYDLGDAQYIQYRIFSRSGGDTIDVNISGERIKKVHVKQ